MSEPTDEEYQAAYAKTLAGQMEAVRKAARTFLTAAMDLFRDIWYGG